MKTHIRNAVLCSLIALFFSNAAFATDYNDTRTSNYELGFSLGLEIMEGFTQYQRGGSYVSANGSATVIHSPLSELKFPLDVYLGSISAHARWKRVFLNASYKLNLNEKAGKMQDSDWGIWYLYGYPSSFTRVPTQDTLDIFSESDAKLTANLWNLNIGLIVVEQPRWSLSSILGYKHQNFDYDITELNQWYPSYTYYTLNAGSYASLPTTSVRGAVIGYEITYEIPYAKLAFEGMLTDDIILNLNAGYCPRIKSQDRDDHILRNLVGLAEYKGKATMFGLGLTGKINRNASMGISYDFMRITTHGRCNDYENGLYTGVIDQHSMSIQRNTALKFTYLFH